MNEHEAALARVREVEPRLDAVRNAIEEWAACSPEYVAQHRERMFVELRAAVAEIEREPVLTPEHLAVIKEVHEQAKRVYGDHLRKIWWEPDLDSARWRNRWYLHLSITATVEEVIAFENQFDREYWLLDAYATHGHWLIVLHDLV